MDGHPRHQPEMGTHGASDARRRHDGDIPEEAIEAEAERRDTESPSHQRPPYADPLPQGDPTAPGAPHEAGGQAMRQSEVNNPATTSAATPEDETKGRPTR